MDLTGYSLLAVFAHPDDESLACGGLLAWCAQLGARVSLLCATHGEQGPLDMTWGPAEAGPCELKIPDLGEIRAQELAAAARTLGVAEVALLDYEDGMLPWVDATALETDIVGAIRRLRPDVVITFGQDGLYWHPDHIAIHERTTAAVAALGDEAPALYYVTMPPGSMRTLVDAVAERRAGDQPLLVLGIADPDAFGVEAETPSLVVDVGELAARKLAALKCHRTQVVGSAFALVTDDQASRLLGTEHFRRAQVGSMGEAFIEALRS